MSPFRSHSLATHAAIYADALSDTFEGISSAHLQALFAAQERLQ